MTDPAPSIASSGVAASPFPSAVATGAASAPSAAAASSSLCPVDLPVLPLCSILALDAAAVERARRSDSETAQQLKSRAAAVDQTLQSWALRRGHATEEDNNCLLDCIWQAVAGSTGRRDAFFTFVKRAIGVAADASLSINDPSQGVDILRACQTYFAVHDQRHIHLLPEVFVADNDGNMGRVDMEPVLKQLRADGKPLPFRIILMHYNHYEPLIELDHRQQPHPHAGYAPPPFTWSMRGESIFAHEQTATLVDAFIALVPQFTLSAIKASHAFSFAHLNFALTTSTPTYVIGPNGTGKTNIIRLVQFFAAHFPGSAKHSTKVQALPWTSKVTASRSNAEPAETGAAKSNEAHFSAAAPPPSQVAAGTTLTESKEEAEMKLKMKEAADDKATAPPLEPINPSSAPAAPSQEVRLMFELRPSPMTPLAANLSFQLIRAFVIQLMAYRCRDSTIDVQLGIRSPDVPSRCSIADEG